METQSLKPDCTFPDRERLMRSYVAEALTADEAEVFEAHYFACDECWREMQLGLEIRAAVPASPAVAGGPVMPAPPVRQLQWRWLAAAASVVLVVSIWRLTGTAPALDESPVESTATRGPSQAPQTGIPVSPPAPTVAPATRPAAPPQRSGGGNQPTLRAPSGISQRAVATRDANGDIRISWTATDKATSYVVLIFSVDGAQLLRRETGTPSVLIDAANVAVFGRADERLYAKVDAVDAQGVTFSSSPRITIPARRETPR